MKFISKFKNGMHFIINAIKEEKILPVPQLLHEHELLKNKVALIVGGSGGIGYAMTEAFTRVGCKVIIAGTDAHKLETCCKNLCTDRVFGQSGGGGSSSIFKCS